MVRAAPDIHMKFTATNRAMCRDGVFPESRLTRDARRATCSGCLEMVADPPVREPQRVPEGQEPLPGQEPLFDLEEAS